MTTISAKAEEGPLGSMVVPLGFMGASFLGFLSLILLPDLVSWVSLPSMSLVGQNLGLKVLLLPVQLAAFSFFPASFGYWFQTSVHIICVGMLAASEFSSLDFRRAFLVGAAVGGISFFIVAPPAAMVGPSFAVVGLLGYAAVFAIRRWKSLPLPARLFAIYILLMAAAAPLFLFAGSFRMGIGQAFALGAGVWLASRTGVGAKFP